MVAYGSHKGQKVEMPVGDVDDDDSVRLEQFEVDVERLHGREVVRYIVACVCIYADDVVRLDPRRNLGLQSLSRIAEDDISLRRAPRDEGKEIRVRRHL